ncbi:hypothetical protein B0H11DRAFT_2250193 [Mycena galericulata]|nr:hypothetical protein B0H11DRAFT_2250193 [Mycena galericulata]
MPSTLSEINEEPSDDEESSLTDEEVDQLASDTSDFEERDCEIVETAYVAEYLSSDDTPLVASDRFLGTCKYCELALGGNTAGGRAFRCNECAALQCEGCCYDIHVCRPEHRLLEWDAHQDEWFRTNVEDSGLSDTHTTRCGNCD